jgi:hypothetical protein
VKTFLFILGNFREANRDARLGVALPFAVIWATILPSWAIYRRIIATSHHLFF